MRSRNAAESPSATSAPAHIADAGVVGVGSENPVFFELAKIVEFVVGLMEALAKSMQHAASLLGSKRPVRDESHEMLHRGELDSEARLRTRVVHPVFAGGNGIEHDGDVLERLLAEANGHSAVVGHRSPFRRRSARARAQASAGRASR